MEGEGREQEINQKEVEVVAKDGSLAKIKKGKQPGSISYSSGATEVPVPLLGETIDIKKKAKIRFKKSSGR